MTANNITLNFKGLIAPVFTAFHDDNRRTVNLNQIAPYAKYLKKNGIDGLLVNGTTGEGMSMSVEERKQTAERWQKVSEELEITTMIHIGGAPFADVIELELQHHFGVKSDHLMVLRLLHSSRKFSPSHIVPGIEASPDRMLHARIFAYPDSQMYRLGVNFAQIPGSSVGSANDFNSRANLLSSLAGRCTICPRID